MFRERIHQSRCSRNYSPTAEIRTVTLTVRVISFTGTPVNIHLCSQRRLISTFSHDSHSTHKQHSNDTQNCSPQVVPHTHTCPVQITCANIHTHGFTRKANYRLSSLPTTHTGSSCIDTEKRKSCELPAIHKGISTRRHASVGHGILSCQRVTTGKQSCVSPLSNTQAIVLLVISFLFLTKKT